MSDWKRSNLTTVPVHPEGKWFVAIQNIPRLGIRKGHRGFSWRSSMIFIVVPIPGQNGEILGRTVDCDPETFGDYWEREQVPA